MKIKKTVFRNNLHPPKLMVYNLVLILMVFMGCSDNSSSYVSPKDEQDLAKIGGRYISDSLFFEWFARDMSDSLNNKKIVLDSPLKKGLRSVNIILNEKKVSDTLSLLPFYPELEITEEYGVRLYSYSNLEKLNFYELYTLFHFVQKFEKGRAKMILFDILTNMRFSKNDSFSEILYNVESLYYSSFYKEIYDEFVGYADSIITVHPKWKFVKEYRRKAPAEEPMNNQVQW